MAIIILEQQVHDSREEKKNFGAMRVKMVLSGIE